MEIQRTGEVQYRVVARAQLVVQTWQGRFTWEYQEVYAGQANGQGGITLVGQSRQRTNLETGRTEPLHPLNRGIASMVGNQLIMQVVTTWKATSWHSSLVSNRWHSEGHLYGAGGPGGSPRRRHRAVDKAGVRCGAIPRSPGG